MSNVFRVKEWDKYFESAKSRTYKTKSQTYCPNKHGLGYRLLIRNSGDRSKGAAMFGAWRAMTDVLSRQEAPRQGYCTDTGRPDGIPLTPAMLEALTDIPESIFSEMMSAVSSQEVNWLEVIETGTLQGYHKDTSGISKRVCDCEGECECDGKGKGIQEGGCKAGEIQPGASLAEAVDWFLACHPDCQRVPRMQAEQVLNQCLDDQRRLTPKAATALNTMARHYAGAAMRKPLGHLENYLAGRQIQGPTRQRALGRED